MKLLHKIIQMYNKGNITAAIIMEWENAGLVESSRARNVLKETVAQVNQLFDLSEQDKNVPELEYLLKYKAPLELIVTYNESFDSKDIIRFLSGFIGPDNPNFKLSLLSCPPTKYFELKNHGAEHANADIMLFLDSDVIPQPNFLIYLFSSFANTEVNVVGANVFVEHSTLYSKSYALINFDFQSDETDVIPSYEIPRANSIAFRKELFKTYKFPPTGSSFKLGIKYLMNNLKAGGIQVYANLGAQVEHPVPLAKNFLTRGFFHGRDEMMLRQDNKKSQIAKSKSYYKQDTFFGTGELSLAYHRFFRIFKNYKRVNVSIFELPFALCMILFYYSAVALGYLLTMLFPKQLRSDKFDYLIMAK